MSVLKSPMVINALYLNKRLNKLTNATVAVDATVTLPSSHMTIDDHWASWIPEAQETHPPGILPNPYVSVFRDKLVLDGDVDVWEEQDNMGRRICRGIRTMGLVLGTWREGIEQCTSRRSLEGSYFVNAQCGEDHLCVLLCDREEEVPAGTESFYLEAGQTLLWWTADIGDIVQVH